MFSDCFLEKGKVTDNVIYFVNLITHIEISRLTNKMIQVVFHLVKKNQTKNIGRKINQAKKKKKRKGEK